jgi:carbon monoxide dehydrogenase subunit G
MRLEHVFDIDAATDRVWALLDDIESVVSCVPGASAKADGENSYRAQMTVRMGPMRMTYDGHLEIAARDEAAYRVVIKAKAKDNGGQGTASATTTTELEPSGTHTRVTMTTDLKLTGRVAQMGRGLVQPIANDLLHETLENLAALLPPESENKTVAAKLPGRRQSRQAPLSLSRVVAALLRNWFHTLFGGRKRD